jgi:hypothetical protein
MVIKITSDQAKAKLYAALMDEVKARILAINILLSGQTALVGPFVREASFLHLRMICELIAFACVVAHSNIEEADKLNSEYSAGKIVNALERLHPRFYPLPVTKKRNANGSWHMEDAEIDYLTKEGLVALNAKCGNVLHRGTIKKLLSGKIPVQSNFPEITNYLQKIVNLLGDHAIVMRGDESVILCVLNAINSKGAVAVAIASAVDTPFAGK